MLFPTLTFAVFFTVVLAGRWLLFPRNPQWKKIFLLAASYFFYGYWNASLLLLLFLSSTLNYITGLNLSDLNSNLFKKILLFLGVCSNLAILAVFKYFSFLITSLNSFLILLGFSPLSLSYTILLPIGISFFTFQGISYIVDIYRGDLSRPGSFLDFLLYLSFFPQLIAGPIMRAVDFLPQLEKQSRNEIYITDGVIRIAVGLFKKIVIANYLSSLIVDEAFLNPASFSTPELIVSIYGYAVQIYCDFSAYSDMAIGLSLLLGYRLMENFDSPYSAVSLQGFWRRWHISLSTWLRDYLYIPLGGSRKGLTRTSINLLITMLLGGLWHGAAWSFVFWGGLHGIGLLIEKLFSTTSRKSIKPFSTANGMRRLIVFHFVCLTWIFFRAGSLSSAFNYFEALWYGGWNTEKITPFILLLIFLGIAPQYCRGLLKGTIRSLGMLPIPLQGILFGLFLIILRILWPEGVAPFIYFQF